MITRRILLLVAAALFLTAGERASADPTLSLEYVGPSNSNALTLTINGNGKPIYDYSGPYNFSVSASTLSGVNVGSTLSLFCTQYNVNLATNNQNGGSPSNPGPAVAYTVTGLSSSPLSGVASYVNALYYEYSQISNPTNIDQAAFQLALWELAYDGTSVNFSSGNFSVPSNVSSSQTRAVNEATTLLNNILSNAATLNADDAALAGMGTLYALTNNTYQDQLIFIPQAAPAPTPAPPGLILAGIGLVALVGRTRFNRRPVNA